MISSKALRSTSPRSRGLAAAQAGKAASAASSAVLPSATLALATLAITSPVAGLSTSKVPAVGGVAPFAAEEELRRDVGKRGMLHSFAFHVVGVRERPALAPPLSRSVRRDTTGGFAQPADKSYIRNVPNPFASGTWPT